MGNETDERFGRPPFKPPQKHQEVPQKDNMYPLTKMDFNMGHVHDRYEAVLGPLTLFAPYPHEDDLESVMVQLERPVTPIDEEIKFTPTSFSKLAKLVRRRITAKPEIEHLGVEDQKELAAIVMGEVNGIWPDIRTQVEDPFLSAEENKELQRRMTVHIVTVCQQLFDHYIQKAQVLQRRGVFSGPANMSRLKAQLGLDANKFLNILTIRRYLVGELRQHEATARSGSEVDDGCSLVGEGERKPRLPSQPAPLLSYKGLIDASRPKTKSRKKRYATAPEEMAQMATLMPGLDTAKLEAILQDMPRPITSLSSKDDDYRKAAANQIPKIKRQTTEDISWEKLVLKKSDSVPELAVGENLLEELGVTLDRQSVMSLENIEHQLQTLRSPVVEDMKPTPQPGSREYVAEDLRRLVGGKREEEEDTNEEDLAPLLQAVTRSSQHDNKQEMIEMKLEELDKREQQRQKDEIMILKQATHPQPATVSTKLPNQMIARTSDIRVSERVSLSSITLHKNSTIYNDIIDEIDPATVKKLDSNLFLGDEITEVYREIMKTVSTDHLRLDNDGLIEPSADVVDLSGALASASLTKRPSDRVINPALHKDTAPPWGNMELKDWAKTPVSPPKDVRGRPLVIPMTPRGEGKANKDVFGEGYEPPVMPPDAANSTSMMQEMMARSYASWLTWWKNTINTDDYMKYISTQESDYLGVVFHFYNSEDEDGDGGDDALSIARSHKRSKQQLQEVKQKRMDEMRAAKTEFKEGFWNCNAVLLGGLGKDPGAEDEDGEHSSQSPDSAAGVSLLRARRHSGTRILSRKSHKSLTTSRNGPEDGHLSPDRSKSRLREGLSPYPSRTETKISSFTKNDDKSGSEPGPQERLEKVWSTLQMPDHLKLDMAIKYSADEYHGKLDEAIADWEGATALIVKREELIAKLEKFERLASDPNRFFERGYRGSSVARLEEAKIRSTYYRKIDSYNQELSGILADMKRDYNDTVTYQGRPYIDKMQWDRTEMLFWLQEERKKQAIDYESRLRNITPLPVHMTRLEPLPHTPPAAAVP